jgi:hypothetical protein
MPTEPTSAVGGAVANEYTRQGHRAEPPTQTTGKLAARSLVFTTLMGVDLNGVEILIGRAMQHFPQTIKA